MFVASKRPPVRLPWASLRLFWGSCWKWQTLLRPTNENHTLRRVRTLAQAACAHMWTVHKHAYKTCNTFDDTHEQSRICRHTLLAFLNPRIYSAFYDTWCQRQPDGDALCKQGWIVFEGYKDLDVKKSACNLHNDNCLGDKYFLVAMWECQCNGKTKLGVFMLQIYAVFCRVLLEACSLKLKDPADITTMPFGVCFSALTCFPRLANWLVMCEVGAVPL